MTFSLVDPSLCDLSLQVFIADTSGFLLQGLIKIIKTILLALSDLGMPKYKSFIS